MADIAILLLTSPDGKCIMRLPYWKGSCHMNSTVNIHQRESVVTVENVTARLLIDDLRVMDDTLSGKTSHTHVYTELFVCTGGEIAVDTDDGVIWLNAGDILLIPANVPHHKLPSDKNAAWCSIGFTFTKRYTHSRSNLYKSLKQCFGGSCPLLIGDSPEFCRSITDLTERTGEEEYIPALRMVIILSDFANTMSAKLTDRSADLPSESDISRASQLDHIINACFTEDLTCQQAASCLFISQRHLARIVKKRYGVTFHQAVNAKRLAVAAKLLEETEHPIEKISADVGFRTKSSFYRAFAEKYGITPLDYRKKQRRAEDSPTLQ